MSIDTQINVTIAISAVASSIAALCVAYLTYRVLQANRSVVQTMQAQFEATTRPHILIYPEVRPMSNFVELKITNVGASSAENLRLSIDQDYFFNAEDRDASNLRTYPAFAEPIDSFPPRAMLVFGLGVAPNILRSDRSPPRFSVTSEYSTGARNYTEITRIDLHPYMRSAQPNDAVVESLERIAKALERQGR